MQRNPEEPKSLSYGNYLQLNKLLDAQQLQSALPRKNEPKPQPAHDELLFIVVHQAHELWFKQILFELDSILDIYSQDSVPEAKIGLANSRLERIETIFEALIGHLRILETMTPMDFLEFRNYLNPASGFQSVQFRLVEAKLGLPRHHLEHLRSGIFAEVVTEAEKRLLSETLEQKSLFEVLENWLERTPFLDTQEFNFWSAYKDAITAHLDSDLSHVESNEFLSESEKQKRRSEINAARQAFMDLFNEEKHAEHIRNGEKRLSLKATHAALFIYLYRDQPILQAPFRLLTLLTMIDEHLQTWRAQHALMVHRMIGVKIGTGGSSGYEYLRSTVNSHRVFSDLCNLSTFLLPRSSLPELPNNFIRQLGFSSEAS